MKTRITIQALRGGLATLLVTLMLGLISLPPALACSRILWNDKDVPVVVGRSMDWPTSTEPMLTVLPRGMERNGGMLGNKEIIPEKDNPAKWTSKYGSLVTTTYGLGPADGLNEKGLGVHALYFTEADFGDRDKSKAALQAGLWGQYLLDNAATVDEALSLLKKIQPIMVEDPDLNIKSTVHLAIEDASGDSAIIEYVKGQEENPMVYHGREYVVMTNDPPYNEQLDLLAKYNFTNATRETELPGNAAPTHRFVRASFFHSYLPKPKNEREAIASILSIVRNVSVPFGAPAKTSDTFYNTEYRTAIDLTNKRYFFELATSPNVIWADLSKMNLEKGAPVKALNPNDIALSGDVSDKFTKDETVTF